ncbi:NTP transferase domain-containing protein [Sphingopyxis sp. CCNWLW253]|uniref:nucleotidyltransferase family protein n=1 Tax=unclassified Sphingopyxis TaxID=2614943 RepID=UPI00301300BE
MDIARMAAILLCAGQSRRFEAGDKLLYEFGGHPLIVKAAETLRSMDFLCHIAVVGESSPALALLLSNQGYRLVVPPRADGSQEISLQAGIDMALERSPDGVLLALADMPAVSAVHFQALARAMTPARPALSVSPEWTGPPWAAAAGWIRDHRASLKQALRRQAIRVAPMPDELIDVDRLADIGRLRAAQARREKPG